MPTAAARLAVLPVPADDAAAQALADRVQAAVPKAGGAGGVGGDVVVDDATVAQKMRGPPGAPVDVAVARAGLAAANEAFAALDHERSVSLLESVIAGLEADRDFSADKRALLEEARLSCAQRLMGLAGPSETGKAETRNGESARRHLQNVLKASPGLLLPPGRFPPKMKSLFALAESDVQQMGTGGLHVLSTPPGATVWVDGRSIGETPLRLPQALSPGPWRLWIEQGGRRSIARVVDVSKDVVVGVEIDLGFEGALVPAATPAPGLTPTAPFTPPMLQRLASFLDVDRVLLVGLVAEGADGTEGARPWVLAAGGQQPLRAGTAVSATSAVDATAVAAWATGTDVDGFAPGVPATVFAAAAGSADPVAANVEADEKGGAPWLLIGAGVVAAVVVAGAVAGVTYLLTPTTVGLAVEPLP